MDAGWRASIATPDQAIWARGGSERDPLDGRSEADRLFLRRLRELLRDIFNPWLSFPQLVVTVDVDDPDERSVLRTLRADFDGSRLVAASDQGHQVTAMHLDPTDPDLFELPSGSSPELGAEAAAAWFREQAARLIERHEWDGPTHVWTRWILKDTGRALAARYPSAPIRPPDRIIRLVPPVMPDP
jgi:hypothetical protein